MALISKLRLNWLTFGWLFLYPCHLLALSRGIICVCVCVCCEAITTCYHLEQRKSNTSMQSPTSWRSTIFSHLSLWQFHFPGDKSFTQASCVFSCLPSPSHCPRERFSCNQETTILFRIM